MCRGQSCLTCQRCELVQLETRAYGDDAVVYGQWVPAKQPLRGDERAGGQRPALQIDSQNCPPRDSSEGAQQGDDALILEVVQEQGTEDDVDAALVEGERESVANHARRFRHGGMNRVEIERSDRSARERPADGIAHVTGAAADVEDGERFSGMRYFADQPPGDAVPAGKVVDARQIAQALPGIVVGRGIEKLRLDNALREPPHLDMVTGEFMAADERR